MRSGEISAPIPAGLARAAERVLPAIARAAGRTGVDFGALVQTARLESGFNPAAKARTSSATGLFQFTEGTWLATLARHGARLGVNAADRAGALALRKDPEAASLMAAAHMADNAAALQARLGRAVSTVDLYMAHFLGVGGAARFLKTLSEAPDKPAAGLLPQAAAANRAIFFEGGMARSVQQVHDLFARRLGAGQDESGTGPAIGRIPVRFAPPASEPPSGPAAELAALVSGVRPSAAAGDQPSPAQAHAAGHAARLAYLMLADLGA
jgi:hypothetical protein